MSQLVPSACRLAIVVLVGGLLASAWFAGCAWLATFPVTSEVSLALAFRPWWRHWLIALALFLLPVLLLLAFHLCRSLLGKGAFQPKRAKKSEAA
jgi:hypothetical protein